jgi:hypothetical protein
MHDYEYYTKNYILIYRIIESFKNRYGSYGNSYTDKKYGIRITKHDRNNITSVHYASYNIDVDIKNWKLDINTISTQKHDYEKSILKTKDFDTRPSIANHYKFSYFYTQGGAMPAPDEVE